MCLSLTSQAQKNTQDLQNLSLEQLMELEVVVGASKFEQKTSDAPASVTIITADDIKRMGFRNMFEVLNSVRSFYNSYDRNYDYIGIRGLNKIGNYNTGILVTVDGHRINDSVYDTVGFHQDFIIDLENIERVEIIRGPSSSLYGSNALFGVINVITKKGANFNKTQIVGEYGSLDTKRIRAAWGKQFESGFDVLVSASSYDSKGNKKLYYEEFVSTNDGFYENNDYERAQRAFLRLTKEGFAFQAAFDNRLVGVPTASYETVFNDPRNSTKDTRYYINFSYTHKLAEEL